MTDLLFILASTVFTNLAAATPADIPSLVQQVLQAHEQSPSYQAWGTSEWNPDHVWENVATEPEKVCAALKQISAADLTLFFDWIPRLDPACAQDLQARIDSYMAVGEKGIAAQVEVARRLSPGSRPESDAVLGPSVVKTVDTEGGPVFVRGELGPKQVALTFDDGPHSRLTGRLLETLRREEVLATFFVLGSQAKNYPSVLEAIAEQGHTVGTHTMDHRDLRKLSYDRGVSQISEAFEAVLSILNSSAPFFRFPYGARTKALSAFLKESDVSAFYWNMDSWDWKIKDPQKLYENCLTELHRENGGIILFHDIHPQTITVLPWFLRALAHEGYKTVVYQPLEPLDRHDAGP